MGRHHAAPLDPRSPTLPYDNDQGTAISSWTGGPVKPPHFRQYSGVIAGDGTFGEVRNDGTEDLVLLAMERYTYQETDPGVARSPRGPNPASHRPVDIAGLVRGLAPGTAQVGTGSGRPTGGPHYVMVRSGPGTDSRRRPSWMHPAKSSRPRARLRTGLLGGGGFAPANLYNRLHTPAPSRLRAFAPPRPRACSPPRLRALLLASAPCSSPPHITTLPRPDTVCCAFATPPALLCIHRVRGQRRHRSCQSKWR
jgi:hypothetical protein